MNTTPTPNVTAAADRLAKAICDIVHAFAEAAVERTAHAVSEAKKRSESASSPVPERILLDAREAAKALGVSTGTLFNLTAPRGPIRAFKIGALVRYAPEDLRCGIEPFRLKPASE